MTKKTMFEMVFPNANKNNGITFIEEKLNNRCDVCHNITEDYETTEDQQVFCIDCMEEHND